VSILRRLLGTEQRNVSGGQWLSDKPAESSAGVQLNQQNATSIGALYAAVKLYADTVASLPVGAFIRDGGVRRPVTRPLWIDRPIPANPNYTGFQFRHAVVSSLLLDGNAFILFLTDRLGDVVETRVLDPQKVEIRMDEMGAPIYIVSTGDTAFSVGPDQMVHIPLFATAGTMRGMSPVEHHRTTLGLASATQLYAAKFYENGAAPSAVIRVSGELTQDVADSLRSSFGRRHEGVEKMHKIAVLTGGADYQQISAKISDMQLVETMHWGVESIARIYGVPLHLLQYPGGNTSYSSVEVISIEWLRLGLGPLIARIEAGLQRLIVGQTTFIKFNIDGLLRPTTKERMDSYAVALNSGILNLNEVRALEDRPPLPVGGDEFWKPLNIGTVGKEPQA
jgi:HK97 family phage portal protein